MTALDRCYEVEQGRPFYFAKPLSLLLTTVLTALVLLVMLLIPIGTFVRNRLIDADYVIPFTSIEVSTWTVWAFDVARHAVGLLAGFLALSLIYNICPSVRMRWRLFSPGAVLCFGAWVAIGLGFRAYLNSTAGTQYAQTFGPAAGLAMLLLVFYLYGVVLLIGAELNSEIDFVRLKAERGTRDLRPLQKALREKELAARKAKLANANVS
jgi:membrane protein